MLETIRGYLSENWIGTLIGVVGILYAIYEAKKHKGPKICFQFIGSRIISSNAQNLPGGLQVTYNGQNVPFLSKTQIIMWNKGVSPVKRSDLSFADPIRFMFSDPGSILHSEISKITRDSNKFGIDIIQNELVCSFDFLDRMDGALITIWHTSQETQPKARGTVIGQRQGPVSYGRYIAQGRNVDSMRKPENLLEKTVFTAIKLMPRSIPVMSLTMIIIGLMMTLYPFLRGYIPFLPPRAESNFTLEFVMGAIYIGTGSIFLSFARRKFPKSLLPDELQSKDITVPAA